MVRKLKTLVFLACVTAFTSAHKYEIQYRDEKAFIPCPEYPNNFLDRFIKMPENITLLSDAATYIGGDVKITYDFKPLQKFPVSIEFYKRNRGSWQKTVFSMRREDLCKSMFNPTEMWGSNMNELRVEQRKCPFEKGQIFSLDFTIDQTFEMPSGSFEGEFWAHFEGGDKKNLEEFCCVDFYYTVYRV